MASSDNDPKKPAVVELGGSAPTPPSPPPTPPLPQAPTGPAAAGRAYEAIAQSAAIAVQDATDALRNMSTISTTAVGVAMARYIESDGADEKILNVVYEAQALWAQAAGTYAIVGQSATTVLSGFTPGMPSSKDDE